MDAYGFILIVVVIVSASAWNETQEQGVQCGGSRCRAQPEGVECVDLKCRCPPAYVGNGHYYCARGDQSCVCTLYGEPFVQAFGASVVRVPYPCRVTLGTMSTPASIQTATCTLEVTALLTYIPSLETNPQTSFVSGIQISGTAHKGRTYEFGATILEEGFVTKEFKLVSLPRFGSLGGIIGVECYVTSEDYFAFRVKACGIEVGFRPSDHSVYIQIPKGSTSQGLCQKCTTPPDFYVTSAANASVSPAVLGSFLSALNIVTNDAMLSLMNPNEPQCATLKGGVEGCHDGLPGGLRAVEDCSFLYADLSVGQYLLRQSPNASLPELSQTVLKTFSDCVDALCMPNASVQAYCNALHSLLGTVSASDILSTKYRQQCSQFW